MYMDNNSSKMTPMMRTIPQAAKQEPPRAWVRSSTGFGREAVPPTSGSAGYVNRYDADNDSLSVLMQVPCQSPRQICHLLKMSAEARENDGERRQHAVLKAKTTHYLAEGRESSKDTEVA